MMDSQFSEFTPDITPIMLAAHTNNYEIIKLLVQRKVMTALHRLRGIFFTGLHVSWDLLFHLVSLRRSPSRDHTRFDVIVLSVFPAQRQVIIIPEVNGLNNFYGF